MKRVRLARIGERGFTLNELLIAVAMVGLVMAALLSILMAGQQSYLTGTSQVNAQSSARIALEQMAQEIRGAGYNPQNVTSFNPIVGGGVASTCPPTTSPTTTGFTIQSDTDGNGVIGATECVLYVLNGMDLQRRDFSDPSVAAPQTIIGGVQALQFTYWDESGNQIDPTLTTVQSANVPNIRSIQVAITTLPDQQSQAASWQTGNVRVSMVDRIRIRNR